MWLNHFVLQEKLTQHCKSTVFLLKKKNHLIFAKKKEKRQVTNCYKTISGPTSDTGFLSRVYKVLPKFFLSLIFKKYIFNWRIIALQYCIGFFNTTWIRHRYTYVPFLPNLLPTCHPIPPLQVITEPWLEFPESYSKFPPAILHMVVCMFSC